VIAYRIADGRFPVFDGTGAMLHGARWNSPGFPVIYAAETFAGAVLEVLVHTSLGRVPRHTYKVVRIEIPNELTESLKAGDVPGWRDADLQATRAFGDEWLRKNRSAVLLVPGAATGGREHNVLINPRHPEFARIVAGPSEPMMWDARLFLR
jgi:RES domain-containing protein